MLFENGAESKKKKKSLRSCKFFLHFHELFEDPLYLMPVTEFCCVKTPQTPAEEIVTERKQKYRAKFLPACGHTILSTSRCIPVFYMCFHWKMLYFASIMDSMTLNLWPIYSWLKEVYLAYAFSLWGTSGPPQHHEWGSFFLKIYIVFWKGRDTETKRDR